MSVSGRITSVACGTKHTFSKQAAREITLTAGLGVVGDAHAGETVKHRSRVKVDPARPNLRQVHLIHEELFTELANKGFAVRPADLGENITTSNVDLLDLPRGTVLKIGDSAELEVTGLRNPCAQIESFMPGLLKQLAVKRGKTIERKAGIMTVVLCSGTVRVGDEVTVITPKGPHIPLERV